MTKVEAEMVLDYLVNSAMLTCFIGGVHTTRNDCRTIIGVPTLPLVHEPELIGVVI